MSPCIFFNTNCETNYIAIVIAITAFPILLFLLNILENKYKINVIRVILNLMLPSFFIGGLIMIKLENNSSPGEIVALIFAIIIPFGCIQLLLDNEVFGGDKNEESKVESEKDELDVK